MRFLARWLLCAGLLVSSGCQFFFPTPIEGAVDASKPAPVVRSSGVAFRPGEVFKADVFFDGVVAGRGQMAVSAPCSLKGHTSMLRISTTGGSVGLARFLQSAKTDSAALLDPDMSRTVASHNDSTIGDKRAVIDLLIDRGAYAYRSERSEPDKPAKRSMGETRMPLDELPFDGHAILGYLRNWRPEPGTSGSVWAVLGRYPWRGDLVFVGPEVLTTARGQEKAVRIDGVATRLSGPSLSPSSSTPRRPFTLWFSDDERKTPLRLLMETPVAKLTVELTSYGRTEPAAAPVEPCTPLFDEAAMRRDIRQRKRAQEGRKARDVQSAAPSAETHDDAANKPDDDEQEEKDALERFLKDSNP